MAQISTQAGRIMYRSLAFIILLSLAGAARSAVELPVEILQSHLIFTGGELLVSSSEHRQLSLLKMTFRGRTRILQGDVLAGLEFPDLGTVRLKLIGALQCQPESACHRDAWPVVDIDVAGIPEELNCTDCADLITVRFYLEDRRVRRRARSEKAGAITYYPERVFQLPPD
jgi:hypothetical protein